MRLRRTARLIAVTAASLAAGLAGVPASGEQAQHGQTTHHSPLPRITAGGQADWPLHSLDVKGSRYAALDEIDTANVGRLELAWSFATGRGTRHCPGDAAGRRGRDVSQRRLDAVRGERRHR